jgi:NTP pyrophosphatase (non-canonical NTP hydrolase)
MPKPERVQVKDAAFEDAMADVAKQLKRRVKEKGSGAYHSRHEAYGIIAEEFDELLVAMTKNDGNNFEDELQDIAVACIVALASHRIVYK